MGALTRVRRRLFAGVAIVLVIVIGQVVDLIPTIEGRALWAVIVGVGIVLIIIATGIERGRARAAAAIAQVNELLPAGSSADRRFIPDHR